MKDYSFGALALAFGLLVVLGSRPFSERVTASNRTTFRSLKHSGRGLVIYNRIVIVVVGLMFVVTGLAVLLGVVDMA